MSDLYKQVRDLIQRAEAAAYNRGYRQGLADAEKRLLAAIRGTSGEIKPSLISGAGAPADDTSTKAVIQERQRAPKGMVRKLVIRAMRECGNTGIVPARVIERATTDHERMVKIASVRSELRKGRNDGRYRDDGGRWFLARDGEENEEAETPKKDASAPLFNQTEGGD